MQKSGGIRAGFQGLRESLVPAKIKAAAALQSQNFGQIAGIAAKAVRKELGHGWLLMTTTITP
jgi:hypothetical protein